jgi:ERCC4-type nuclease
MENVQVRLIIDKRENAIIDKIREVCDINIELEQLDLGDIIIRHGEEDVLVMERKSLVDLSASICDGRYKEQKYRLANVFGNDKILYVIEGSPWEIHTSKFMGERTLNVLKGAIINTMVRDGIRVMITKNVESTVAFIIDIYKRMLKDINKYKNIGKNDETNDYVDVLNISANKKNNIDKNVCYIMQLCQVPGISKTVAKVIAEKYPDIRALMNAREEDLNQIRVNERKLSKNVVKNILTYM